MRALISLILSGCTVASAGPFYADDLYGGSATGGGGYAVPDIVAQRYSVAGVGSASGWLAARAADSGCVLSLVATGTNTLTDQCGTIASFDSQIATRSSWTGDLYGYESATEAANAAYQLVGDATIRAVVVPLAGSANATILQVNTSGETEDTNQLFHLTVSGTIASAGVQEYGAGVNTEPRWTIPADVASGQSAYIEYTRSADAGTCTHALIYAIDGAADLISATPTTSTGCTAVGDTLECPCPTGGSSTTLLAWGGLSGTGATAYTQLLSVVASDSEAVYDALRAELLP